MPTCEHGVNPKYCKACAKPTKTKSTLSDDQIDNWRAVLFTMFGPYALIMPVSEIIKHKHRLQKQIDALPT
jgi:hypothetical protein